MQISGRLAGGGFSISAAKRIRHGEYPCLFVGAIQLIGTVVTMRLSTDYLLLHTRYILATYTAKHVANCFYTQTLFCNTIVFALVLRII